MPMESGILVIAIILIILAMIMGIVKNASSSPRISPGPVGRGRNGGYQPVRLPSVQLQKPPEALGVPAGHPARSIADRLEAALSADFEARVKDRVLKRVPSLSDSEWQWRWFELKRYFLMCAVLRGVPMYSAKVDEVWHEMLMFTREYEQFCKQLCGAFIHHAPHAPGEKPEPAERSWFDWVYGEFFYRYTFSERLWGSFYKTPLSRNRIEELENADIEELRRRRFNEEAAQSFADIDETIRYLIGRGQTLAAAARSASEGAELESTRNFQDPDMSPSSRALVDSALMTGVLSAALFYASMGPDNEFQNQMEEAQREEKRDSSGDDGAYYGADNGGEGGSGGFGDDRSGDSPWNGNDGSGDSSGSDGGGSTGGSDGGGSSCSSGGGSDGGGSSCSSGGGSSCGGGGGCSS